MKKSRCVALITLLIVSALLVSCSRKKGTADFVIEDGILKEYAGNDEEIVVPDEVTQIAQGIELGNVKKITIPGTVKKIEKGTFYNTNLDVMILEEGVEEIEEYGISYDHIKHLYIPSSVTVIGRDLLDYDEHSYEPIVIHCDSANEEAVRESVESNLTEFCVVPDYSAQKEKGFIGYGEGEEYVVIDGVLYLYTGSDKDVVISEDVKVIKEHAINNYTDNEIESVYIPATVEKIEKYAVNTKVSEVILETGIERHEWDIFITAPEEIYVPSSVKEIDYDPMGTGLDLIVHCKEGSYADGIFDEFFQEVTYIYDYE